MEDHRLWTITVGLAAKAKEDAEHRWGRREQSKQGSKVLTPSIPFNENMQVKNEEQNI